MREYTNPAPASPNRTAGPPKDAVCTSVNIERSANGGFICEHRYRSAARAKSGLGDPYIPPQSYVYDTFEKMVAGLKKVFA